MNTGQCQSRRTGTRGNNSPLTLMEFIVILYLTICSLSTLTLIYLRLNKRTCRILATTNWRLLKQLFEPERGNSKRTFNNRRSRGQLGQQTRRFRSGVRINKFYSLLVFKEDPRVCTFSVCPCVRLSQFWKQKTNIMIWLHDMLGHYEKMNELSKKL